MSQLNADLTRLLHEWESKHAFDAKRFTRNEAGIAIKRIVESAGHWKAKQRGNPRKGYQKRMESL